MASYSIIVTTLLLCGLLGHTNSQRNQPAMDKNVYNVLNAWDINNLQITDGSNLNGTAIPTGEALKNIVKQKCEKNGGAGAFEKADRAMPNMAQCIENFVSMEQQSEERQKFAVTEDLHYVFKYYCRKTPVFKKCVNDFRAALELCMNPQEKDTMKIAEDIINAVLNYVCFEDGDRIVQFKSAHGPECVQSKQQEILQCVMPTIRYYSLALNRTNGSLAGSDNDPFPFGAKDCMEATTMKNCIVNKLDECPNQTPAKIIDSLIDVILRATPCKEFLTDPSAASTSTINLLATSIVFLVLELM